MNNKRVPKLNLQYGDSLRFRNGLEFRQPTVMDIKELGEEYYFWFMSLFMKSPTDIIHQLFEIDIDYEKITKDELFEKFVESNEPLFIVLFEYFTNAENVEYIYIDEYEQKCICGTIKESNKKFIIDFDSFDILCGFIKDVHFYKPCKVRKFSDDETKKDILKYEIEEMKFFNKNKESSGFSNLISSLVRANQRTWEYVFSLTVYRLYDELYRAMKEKDVTQLIAGVYAGNVDGKKLKSDLDWTNNLV